LDEITSIFSKEPCIKIPLFALLDRHIFSFFIRWRKERERLKAEKMVVGPLRFGSLVGAPH